MESGFFKTTIAKTAAHLAIIRRYTLCEMILRVATTDKKDIQLAPAMGFAKV